MLRRRLRELRSDQGGLTLIELLVVAVAGMVIFGGAVELLNGTTRRQSEDRAETLALQMARTTAEAFTREVREASGLEIATSSRVRMLTWVHRESCDGPAAPGLILCRVEYTCEAGSCLRAEGSPEQNGTVGGPTEIATDLAGPDVFSFEPGAEDARFVEIALEVEAERSGDSVSVQGGAALRNAAYGA